MLCVLCAFVVKEKTTKTRSTRRKNAFLPDGKIKKNNPLCTLCLGGSKMINHEGTKGTKKKNLA